MMEQFLSFFISSAHAEPLGTPPANGSFSFLLMFVAFVFLLYFGIWRPQSKRAKEQQNLLGSLAKGDEVITVGGILGRINKITGQYVNLSIADNVEMIVQKESITSILPKGTLKTIE